MGLLQAPTIGGKPYGVTTVIAGRLQALGMSHMTKPTSFSLPLAVPP